MIDSCEVIASQTILHKQKDPNVPRAETMMLMMMIMMIMTIMMIMMIAILLLFACRVYFGPGILISKSGYPILWPRS